VTLEAALRMVAEMGELKLVTLAEGLFITTPTHAEALRIEDAKPCNPNPGIPTRATQATPLR
jgi:hypothetical protein